MTFTIIISRKRAGKRAAQPPSLPQTDNEPSRPSTELSCQYRAWPAGGRGTLTPSTRANAVRITQYAEKRCTTAKGTKQAICAQSSRYKKTREFRRSLSLKAQKEMNTGWKLVNTIYDCVTHSHPHAVVVINRIEQQHIKKRDGRKHVIFFTFFS